MPTVAKCDLTAGGVGLNTEKRKTSGGIGRTAGGIGRCKYMSMTDSYKKSNTGKIAGGLAGATFSLHTLFKPNNCFAKFVADLQKTTNLPKIKIQKNPTTTAIGGIIGTGILTGLGILLGGSVDKAIEKAKAIQAQRNLADLEINRNID